MSSIHSRRATRAATLAAILLVAGCSEAPVAKIPAPVRDRQATALTPEQIGFLKIEEVGGGGDAPSAAAPGRVAYRPQALSSLGAPFSGRITSVSVRPGERVKAGTPLVVLQSADASAARAQLEQATARASAAEDQLRRQTEMMARGVGLEVERVEAEARAREARAELERTRRAIAFAGGGQGGEVILRAPAAGVVVSVRASAGAIAEPGGEPLVEVADPGRVWVVADVPEPDVARIAPGQQVRVRVPAIDATLDGTVDGVGSAVDAASRRLPVYIALKAPPAGLTPGMLTEVRFAGSRDGLSVPVSAVLIKDGHRRVVYLQRPDGRFEAREVRTGRSSGGRVAILEGVAAGDRIVVKGALLLDGEAELLL
ncbi:MAG: efflux RND transporter periplasmic adaptor subunit [bacterium]|jgi:cobalt-zinc-cadmium efflux system membrane fusion protein|nr:efflux RND transporter periplasmic adaptor subunit [Betaproteobacteria bacterium]